MNVPGLVKRELVAEGLARRDRLLGQAGHAVHAVGQEHAVPVHRGRTRQPVGDVDTQWSPSSDLDGGPGRAAVVAPAVHEKAVRHLLPNGLRHQVKHLYPVHYPEGERHAVRGHHGSVVAARLPRELNVWRRFRPRAGAVLFRCDPNRRRMVFVRRGRAENGRPRRQEVNHRNRGPQAPGRCEPSPVRAPYQSFFARPHSRPPVSAEKDTSAMPDDRPEPPRARPLKSRSISARAVQ